MIATRRRMLTATAGLAMPFIYRARAGRTVTFCAPGGLFQELYQASVIEAFQRDPGVSSRVLIHRGQCFHPKPRMAES